MHCQQIKCRNINIKHPQDLDDSHLFISPDVLEQLKGQIDDLMDKISVPIIPEDQKR